MTLVIALISLVLLSALGTSLTVVMNTELRAAANYAASREAIYAADGALQIAARELLAVGDWNALLSSGALSALSTVRQAAYRPLGDGSTVDLAQATQSRKRRTAPVGREQSRVAVVCVRMARVRRRTSSRGLATIRARTTEIRRSTAGARRTRAPASSRFAPKRSASGGAHKVLEATVRREIDEAADPIVAMLSWQEIR